MRGLLRSAAASAPLLAALALVGVSPTPVAAQVTGTTGTTTTTTTTSNQAIDSNFVVRRNGDIVRNGTIVYANIADCGGTDFPGPGGDTTTPKTFEFSATYTANVPIVELWLGVGSAENCATQANRLRPSNNASLPPVCTFLGTDTSNTRNPKIVVPGNRLFNQTSGLANPADTSDVSKISCDKLNGGQTYTLYFLPLQTPTTNVNASDPITVGVLSTLKATFTPYTQRPEAPASLSGQSGETEIGVSFKAPASSMTLTRYTAYFDTTGGNGTAAEPTIDAGSMDAGLDAGLGATDASVDARVPDDNPGSTESGMDASTADGGTGTAVACGSGYLKFGEEPPANPPASDVRSEGPAKTTTIKLQHISDIPVGTNIAVSIVSVDPAGNESLLAQPICVQRVSTTGFIDACDQTPGCSDQLDSCSLTPGQRGSAWSLSVFALALIALIRRASRRRA